MKAAPPTTAQLVELMLIGLQLGELPAHAYVLGVNVLQHMDRLGSTQVVLRLDALKGRALSASGYDLPSVENMLYRGAGTPLFAGHISPYFIASLQQLHRLGFIYSALSETDLNSEDSLAGHFTLDPSLREGKHWGENSPIVYRRTEDPLKKVVARFRRQTRPERKPAKVEPFHGELVPLKVLLQADTQ